MNIQLSARSTRIAESQTFAMNAKSQEMRSKGINVINLSVGEPDFFTPEHVKAAAKDAIDKNYSFYSATDGYLDLRQVIANKLLKENNLSYTPKQITVSNGAKHALSNILMATINEGDEVIIVAPVWGTYIELVRLYNGTPIIIQTSLESNFKLSPEQLRAAITPKTKALMLCSPNNPTGTVYSHEELAQLAAVLNDFPNILIISDEIYEHINFRNQPHASLAHFENLFERVAVINGVSKGYAMTGYRIGYSATPAWLAPTVSKIQSQMTSGPSSIAQRAALTALDSEQDFTEKMRQAFLNRRDLLLKGIAQIPGIKYNVPEGAFYLFPDVSAYFGKSDGTTTINSSDDLALYLLAEAHVATVAGSAFSAPNCIRLSYATSEENLSNALEQLKAAFLKLK